MWQRLDISCCEKAAGGSSVFFLLDRWKRWFKILIETVQKEDCMGKITIKDVAALAGVSVGTASMALNDSPKVSAETKKNVMAVVQKLGYRRDPYARSLSLSSSRSIGFLAPGFRNPFFGEVAEALQLAVEERNNSLMFGITNDSTEQEAKIVDQFLDRGVDGLIIIPAEDSEPDLSHIRNLLNHDFPLVFLTGYYPEIPFHAVMADLAEGSYELTKGMLLAGLRNIIMIAGNPALIPFRERIEGFRRALDECGAAFDESKVIISDGMSYEGGYAAIDKVYDEIKPDGIIAINDVMAMGVISRLRSKGIRVPEDVSVAGYDDISVSSIQETPLTTVEQPIALMCSEAVDMLFAIMEGRAAPEGVVRLPVSVRHRRSAKTG